MAQHTVKFDRLNESITTDPDWDRTLTISWERFAELSVGDGLIIEGSDGIYLATIRDVGDAELGENWITVDMT